MRQELRRKSIHLITNSLIPIIYLLSGIPQFWMSILLGLASVLWIIIDLGRTRNIWLSKIFRKFFNGMLRTHELDGKLTGASYVMIGSFITIALFPPKIAVLALLYASFGDSFAALIGKKFGKIRIWNKTIEGSMAGLVACILVSFFIPEVSRIVKYSGAVAAMLIELLPIKIDDNLRIPFFSGLIMIIVLELI